MEYSRIPDISGNYSPCLNQSTTYPTTILPPRQGVCSQYPISLVSTSRYRPDFLKFMRPQRITSDPILTSEIPICTPPQLPPSFSADPSTSSVFLNSSPTLATRIPALKVPSTSLTHSSVHESSKIHQYTAKTFNSSAIGLSSQNMTMADRIALSYPSNSSTSSPTPISMGFQASPSSYSTATTRSSTPSRSRTPSPYFPTPSLLPSRQDILLQEQNFTQRQHHYQDKPRHAGTSTTLAHSSL